ncbi:hypothetical protein N175_02500 [Vibrio anguillarum M3]|nr:hypothetical protein N175_02500 [Vibrio anguillarum M3]
MGSAAVHFLLRLDKLRRIIRTKNTLAILFEKYPENGFLCEISLISMLFTTRLQLKHKRDL